MFAPWRDAKLSAVTLATGTVTFVLTDVEGSTSLWAAHHDAMAEAMRRHHAILAAAVQQHGGARPEEQGEGDSAVAVCVRPDEAVKCALDLQCALVAEPWPEGAELRVRVALHTGEAVLRDERNYTGPAIHRCARLRGIAAGGQTVVSRSTWELTVDRLPGGAALRDLGLHQLRDLGCPEQVYQLEHADLPADFPPLRSASVLPNNLPLQLTTFVGREAELEQTRELLDASRLLTLTGAGGCGKTRLALHLGAEVLDAYRDGVWWVDLAPLTDPELVAHELAATLSVRGAPGQPIGESLKLQLRSRELLVILDNCEHLLDVCARLTAELLAACSGVSFMARAVSRWEWRESWPGGSRR